MKSCNEGYYDLDGAAQNGCEYHCTPSGAETCDGLDNDCDGLIDNADPELDARTATSARTVRAGRRVCARRRRTRA